MSAAPFTLMILNSHTRLLTRMMPFFIHDNHDTPLVRTEPQAVRQPDWLVRMDKRD
jgi:hypothetical protein